MYLHRHGLVNSPHCSCNNNKIADLNHMFLECTNHVLPTNELIAHLKKYGFQLPINVSTITSTNHKHIIDFIIKFIKTTNINTLLLLLFSYPTNKKLLCGK